MGTRTADQDRVVGKSGLKKGLSNKMPKSFAPNHKVVSAPKDCPACRFHDDGTTSREEDKE